LTKQGNILNQEKQKPKQNDQEKVLQENISDRKLWSPKDKIKLRDTGRQVATCILEARHRRKQHTDNSAKWAQKSRHSRTEVIGLEEALEMRRGKSECRDKMERQKIHPGGSIIRECNNLSFIRLILSLDD
jgi:hypothetical protein